MGTATQCSGQSAWIGDDLEICSDWPYVAKSAIKILTQIGFFIFSGGISQSAVKAH